MAAACAQTPTGMSAVLGGDPDEVLAAIDKHGLTPANLNGAGQIVAAGALDGLAALKADPPAKARIMPLSVAGAFHTEYMASAREELEGVVTTLHPSDPTRRLLSNADGTAVDTGAEVVRRLVSQVTSPVRFDACLATMRELGVTAVLELPPAGALAGLAKREWKGQQVEGRDIEILAVSPKDLDRARELLGDAR
jgi:[acyl-carrier-protein] S-malonyltransferase